VSEDLTRAIRLRKEGRAEEARAIHLELAVDRPDDPQVQYQCAWVHDSFGREREAVPFHERAIAGGLSGRDLEGAFVGLGSTYRSLGEYRRAVEALREGVARFPENRAMEVFLAMALYNVGEHREATGSLLRTVAETSGDAKISAYKEAILFYAGRLDETWG
jgi:tetratricopeptide (TPR) repeat protein